MPDDFSKLINIAGLTRYDSNVKSREDLKISQISIKNRNEFIKSFFENNRDGKVYGVKFAYNSSGVLIESGTKYGANAGLSVTPSTRTVIGNDDYRDINVFKSIIYILGKT